MDEIQPSLESEDVRSRLPQAIGDWQEILADKWVSTAEADIDKWGQATYPTNAVPLAVIWPATADEVASCLKVAARHRVPLYTVSTGRNWGLGSAVPPRPGCVLMVLTRMNRIVDFDEELAYVAVQPGVTQRQLSEFLASRGSRLQFGVTGSSPDSSIVGNVLERGDAEGVNGDRFENVCALEVVLSTGETIRTGFSRFPGALTKSLHRWGVGPWLDGIFTQSNLGVVTQLTLWLAPRPAGARTFSFAVDSDESLSRLIDALRRLRLSRVLDGGLVFANDVRAIAEQRQFPFDECDSGQALPSEVLSRLRHEHGVLRWNGGGVIYAADDAISEALWSRVEAELSGCADTLESATGDAIVEAAAVGTPVETHLRMAYWRLRKPIPDSPLHLDRDGCGLIWCCPVVPFVGAHVVAAAAIVREVCTDAGFETNIGLHLVAPRSIAMTVAIPFDRSVESESKRAAEASALMHKRFAETGYIPYRVPTSSMDVMHRASDDSLPILRRLKSALDPANVLSPGRYE
ncbi:FAD-binding oxidoreductase [Amycolatopsis sp. NPDC102389]|uniref:FAD-binding oxidoreductase n=1 Tax=Amycolatopsis sp. NPDC102389 TaxID=3363941 RepID=UPI0038182E7C